MQIEISSLEGLTGDFKIGSRYQVQAKLGDIYYVVDSDKKRFSFKEKNVTLIPYERKQVKIFSALEVKDIITEITKIDPTRGLNMSRWFWALQECIGGEKSLSYPFDKNGVVVGEIEDNLFHIEFTRGNCSAVVLIP